jgi:DNA-binding response OmpR family regulator
MAEAAARILVVEDDPDLARLLDLTLRRGGYEPLMLAAGGDIEQRVDEFRPGLVLLDVRLEGGPDGLVLARRIRAIRSVPILFLTAARSLEERLAGFEAGGSDYLTKPFATEELLARVRALLELTGAAGSGVFQVGDVVIDESARTVVAAGPPVELTRTEFDLLVALARKPGQVLSKQQLLELVWGYDAYDTHLVEVHVSALRRKLRAQAEDIIHTVRGVGYVVRVT